MSFMEIEIIRKGATYSCECAKCGATMFAHEWVHIDHNARRDAMEAGTLRCDECCIGLADPETFTKVPDHYAGRYSAPGYVGCTDWLYDTNKRCLELDLRDMYGRDR